MATKVQKVLFTGKTHTTTNRSEGARRGEEPVDIRLSTPGNPANDIAFTGIQGHPAAEQLFAGAWSACYTSALRAVAQMKKVTLPSDTAVDIEVDVGTTGGAYFIQARMDLYMPGVPQDLADALASAAHEACPYSKAVHGNIDVATRVVTTDAVAA